ncbi:hypothetical protein PLICRDRAFT_180744 [Plicaturopsis crispa FD-325 SS-3]|uniref:Zn(2)-C6 fungal-type domain-containing protein n=1 Tax=Plicaturopsis crispa FD-325 SS-3 TaxID=944288 RepID=A0A0C9T4N7_PLICR|nr:hypothetical protein PLICRDRAFT_180744 [Plicaturopsis crispa FD-325 SS-3]
MAPKKLPQTFEDAQNRIYILAEELRSSGAEVATGQASLRELAVMQARAGAIVNEVIAIICQPFLVAQVDYIHFPRVLVSAFMQSELVPKVNGLPQVTLSKLNRYQKGIEDHPYFSPGRITPPPPDEDAFTLPPRQPRPPNDTRPPAPARSDGVPPTNAKRAKSKRRTPASANIVEDSAAETHPPRHSRPPSVGPSAPPKSTSSRPSRASASRPPPSNSAAALGNDHDSGDDDDGNDEEDAPPPKRPRITARDPITTPPADTESPRGRSTARGKGPVSRSTSRPQIRDKGKGKEVPAGPKGEKIGRGGKLPPQQQANDEPMTLIIDEQVYVRPVCARCEKRKYVCTYREGCEACGPCYYAKLKCSSKWHPATAKPVSEEEDLPAAPPTKRSKSRGRKKASKAGPLTIKIKSPDAGQTNAAITTHTDSHPESPPVERNATPGPSTHPVINADAESHPEPPPVERNATPGPSGNSAPSPSPETVPIANPPSADQEVHRPPTTKAAGGFKVGPPRGVKRKKAVIPRLNTEVMVNIPIRSLPQTEPRASSAGDASRSASAPQADGDVSMDSNDWDPAELGFDLSTPQSNAAPNVEDQPRADADASPTDEERRSPLHPAPDAQAPPPSEAPMDIDHGTMQSHEGINPPPVVAPPRNAPHSPRDQDRPPPSGAEQDQPGVPSDRPAEGATSTEADMAGLQAHFERLPMNGIVTNRDALDVIRMIRDSERRNAAILAKISRLDPPILQAETRMAESEARIAAIHRDVASREAAVFNVNRGIANALEAVNDIANDIARRQRLIVQSGHDLDHFERLSADVMRRREDVLRAHSEVTAMRDETRNFAWQSDAGPHYGPLSPPQNRTSTNAAFNAQCTPSSAPFLAPPPASPAWTETHLHPSQHHAETSWSDIIEYNPPLSDLIGSLRMHDRNQSDTADVIGRASGEQANGNHPPTRDAQSTPVRQQDPHPSDTANVESAQRKGQGRPPTPLRLGTEPGPSTSAEVPAAEPSRRPTPGVPSNDDDAQATTGVARTAGEDTSEVPQDIPGVPSNDDDSQATTGVARAAGEDTGEVPQDIVMGSS